MYGWEAREILKNGGIGRDKPMSARRVASRTPLKAGITEDMTAFHSIGIWDMVLYLLASLWLVVIVFTLLSSAHIVKWIALRLIWIQRGILRFMDRITIIFSLQSPRLPPFAFLLSMVAMRFWPLHQLDIKNIFLHDDLTEDVYMEQPLAFVA